MNIIEALILGIVQGVTEWLPVSSSGHLVITQDLLGLNPNEYLAFDLVLHLGTILAVCAYFRKELWKIVRSFLVKGREDDQQVIGLRRLGAFLIVATVPAAIVGVLLTDYVEDIFSITLVGLALLVNSMLLFATARYGGEGTSKSATLFDSVVIGLFQAISIMPGISRSGSAISGGMFRGLEREVAATFAFLLSVPTLLGAAAYAFVKLEAYDLDLASGLVGFVAAFVTGLASIDYLLKVVRAGKFWAFGVYCLVLGAIVIVLTL